MMRKICVIAITLLILTSAFMVFNQKTSCSSTSGPSKLIIYEGPTSILADNNTYNCIFVQLQDSSGQPARALQDTTISLSSSLTNIGTVDSSIIIPKGDYVCISKLLHNIQPRNHNNISLSNRLRNRTNTY